MKNGQERRDDKKGTGDDLGRTGVCVCVRTLYYAAAAAIGANHHSNAVVLMELAKLKNPNNFEARYSLGLLWQEANNLNAASIQYNKIPDGFESAFFDFNIKK